MSKIKITLNGQERFFDSKTSVSSLIKELDLEIRKIAVEINYQILLPESFEDITLKDNDKIEIVHFIGGG